MTTSLYSQTILADSPSAYYRLDEASGTNALDSSGNSKTATYGTGVTLGAASGIPVDPGDSAATFNGTLNGVVSVPALTVGVTAYSFECWINLSTLAYSGHPRIIANDHTDASPFKGYQLWLSGASGAGLTFSAGNGTQTYSATYGSSLAANTWYHVVCVYTGGHVNLYVNSVSVASTATPLSMSAGANNFVIGRATYTTGDFFPGLIDDVSFYNAQIGASQVLAHYTNAQIPVQTSVSESAPTKSEIINASLSRTITETGKTLESVFIANAKSIAFVQELDASYQNEQVSFLPGTQSDPNAQMTNFDLEQQYTRIANSAILNRLQFCAMTYYNAAGAQKLIEGELDALLITEDITMLHVLKTVNDVNTFISSYDYMSSVLEDNPIAYYRLGDGSGGTAADISGNGYNGTVIGGVTTGLPGSIYNDPNTSMSFDGSTGYITLPTQLNTAGWSSLSIELWFKLAINTFGNNPGIIANDRADSNHVGFDLILAPLSDGYAAAYASIGNGSATSTISIRSGSSPGGYAPFATNTWYHLAIVYNGTTFTGYINGKPTFASENSATGIIGHPGYPITIGAYADDHSNRFPGLIDEVAIYPYALDAARLAYRYQIGTGITI